MPAKAAESRTRALRLPADLDDQLSAYAERERVSLNRAVVTLVQSALAGADTPTADAGQRIVVRRLADAAGLLPFVVIDRHYQFDQRSFGTREEARAIAAEWNRAYPQARAPQPALVG